MGRVGCLQGRHAPGDLAGDPQRFAAGRQDADGGTRAQEGVGQLRAGVEQVLAVVEDEQQLFALQPLEQRGHRPLLGQRR
jgi:hypothetical protein